MLRSHLFVSMLSLVALCACDPDSVADTPAEPSASPENEPSTSPEGEPSASPEGEPSASPEGEPSASPEGEPSASPEGEPSASPEGEPSVSPEGEPSASPEGEPSASPEGEPSASPEGEPGFDISEQPCTVENFDSANALQSTTIYAFVNNAIASILFTYESEFVEDTRTTYLYDSEGRLAGTETDTGDDGTVDSSSTYIYAGDIVSGVLTVSATGTETLTTYEWDGLRISRLFIDNGNDGSVDIETSYTYDADDRVTRIETDNDNDGTIDTVTVMTYSTVGNVTTQRTDSGGDGSFENETRTTVDSEGRTTVIESVSLISPDAGVSRTTYQYDSRGRVIRVDTSYEGNPTGHSVYDYGCHE